NCTARASFVDEGSGVTPEERDDGNVRVESRRQPLALIPLPDQVDPERPVGQRLDLRDACAHFLWARPAERDDAETAGGRDGCRELRPDCTTHRRQNDWNVDPE